MLAGTQVNRRPGLSVACVMHACLSVPNWVRESSSISYLALQIPGALLG